jgi:hypothetical protein
MTKVKLKQMRPQEVPLEKILEAMELSGKWVIKKLKGNPKTGPFSEEVLTEKAAKFFPKLAYQKWASGAWAWKDGLDLTTQFIRIIRSEMSHRLRDWKHQYEPEVMSLDNENALKDVAQALAEELEMEEEMKGLGYDIILEWVEDKPDLVVYVNMVREHNNYRTISKKLRITMPDVKELEAEVIAVIRAKRAAK